MSTPLHMRIYVTQVSSDDGTPQYVVTDDVHQHSFKLRRKGVDDRDVAQGVSRAVYKLVMDKLYVEPELFRHVIHGEFPETTLEQRRDTADMMERRTREMQRDLRNQQLDRKGTG